LCFLKEEKALPCVQQCVDVAEKGKTSNVVQW
jgi:hypothetical protein